ncbi:MAG: HlyD family type I secretion periplasmic adaptor subunit, partial [Pseudomonadota bacterium]
MSSDSKSIARLQRGGLVILFLLVFGVGGWSAAAKLSGAVISVGKVVVESNSKKVQHDKGGIISRIEARDGEFVREGQVVLRFDATLIRATYQIIQKQLDEFMARQARLIAERDGKFQILPPKAMRELSHETPLDLDLLEAERRQFEARWASRESRKRQLRQRIAQVEQTIKGLEIQEKAKLQEVKLIDRELTLGRVLWV